MPRITKKGARNVTREMERLANVLEQDFTTLGIPQHIAADAARRLDLLSDAIERHAGLDPKDLRTKQALDGFDPVKEPGFDPEEIGEEESGPLEMETDEPYMRGEFTQQENRELREKQQAGELADGSPDPQPPKAGVQAAFLGLVASLKGSKLTGKKAAAVEKALRLATSVATAAKKGEDEEVVEETEEEVEGAKKGGKKAHGFDLFS